MLCTKPSHSATVADTGKTNTYNALVMKPQVVPDYNDRQQVTYLSDQLSVYCTCLRWFIKGYQNIIFELIFATVGTPTVESATFEPRHLRLPTVEPPTVELPTVESQDLSPRFEPLSFSAIHILAPICVLILALVLAITLTFICIYILTLTLTISLTFICIYIFTITLTLTFTLTFVCIYISPSL